jgi:hypothetical protein
VLYNLWVIPNYVANHLRPFMCYTTYVVYLIMQSTFLNNQPIYV